MKRIIFLILFVGFTISLSACENTYKVTYITNVETNEIIKEVENGAYAPDVSIQKEGYYLKGWYLNLDDCNEPNAAWNFEKDVVTSNTTLHALWLPETYTITFNDRFGEPTWVYQMTFGTDIGALDGITPEAIDGYTFVMWAETFPETMPANNLTFNPIYESE